MYDALAYIGGIFAMISFVPQIWKSLRTRSTGDISWMMLITTLVSVVAYGLYAVTLGLLPVIIMNAIFLATIVLLIAIKLRFDGLRGRPAERSPA